VQGVPNREEGHVPEFTERSFAAVAATLKRGPIWKPNFSQVEERY
jgi:hypothetical protein